MNHKKVIAVIFVLLTMFLVSSGAVVWSPYAITTLAYGNSMNTITILPEPGMLSGEAYIIEVESGETCKLPGSLEELNFTLIDETAIENNYKLVGYRISTSTSITHNINANVAVTQDIVLYAQANSKVYTIEYGQYEIPADLNQNEYSYISVASTAELRSGEARIKVNNNGTISGGTFYAPVSSNDEISGGTFKAKVSSYKLISGGTFEGEVYCATPVISSKPGITGGTFIGDVESHTHISGGTFNNILLCKLLFEMSGPRVYTNGNGVITINGTIDTDWDTYYRNPTNISIYQPCVFGPNASVLQIDSGSYIEVIMKVNGVDRSYEYGTNIISALGNTEAYEKRLAGTKEWTLVVPNDTFPLQTMEIRTVGSGIGDEPSGDVNPSGDETSPSGDITPPSEDVNPSGDETSPSGDETSPSGDVNPSGDETSPSGDVNPSGDETSPSGDVNPSGDINPPSGDVNPSGDINPPSGDVNPSGDINPSSGDVNPSGDETSPSGEQDDDDDESDNRKKTKKYTITFITYCDETIEKVRVTRNNKVKEPKEIIREGYRFEGWYLDEEFTQKYDFNQNVKSSFKLYAKWYDLTDKIILTIDSPEVLLFGKSVTNDVPPIIVNDRTMLPARFIAESLGAKVEWQEKERKVLITKNDIKIVIIIDSEIVYINGEKFRLELRLDSPAFIRNDRTYLPVRFICESLKADVAWEEGMRQVIITKGV